MTNVKTNTPRPFANRAFSRSRTAYTLPPELVEQARKKAIGERSRWTQENIADHLGITLRGYQKVEQKGTSSYERCEVLADFLDVDGVTAEWLWEGRGRGPGVELQSPLDAFSEQPEGSELAEEVRQTNSELAEVRGELSEVRTELRRVLSQLQRGERGPGETGSK